MSRDLLNRRHRRYMCSWDDKNICAEGVRFSDDTCVSNLPDGAVMIHGSFDLMKTVMKAAQARFEWID